MKKPRLRTVVTAIACVLTVAPAAAQLRIVTYNTLDGATNNTRLVLEAIGDEVFGGIAKPIDILLLQEQDEPFTTTQAFVNQLNGIYGAGTYQRGTIATGPSFSSLRQGVVYNTQTVTLLEETTVGDAGGSPRQPREALRTKFRPVGYDSRSDFYIYNSHFKAGSGSSDFDRRTVEAEALREDADALGDDTHVIFAGDFNLRSSLDEAFQELVSPGAAQAFDPADFPGQWKNNFGARTVHTHGGSDVDDRFDFQLPSLEWRDGEGLDLIDGSYRAFGNNGTTYNAPVNSASNTYPLELVEGSDLTRSGTLNALRFASDHLPVVADYQLPSILSADFEPLPDLFTQGEAATLSLFVSNAADVVAPTGADELDYTIEWTGDNAGFLSDIDLADGLANEHVITLDTSAVGLQSTMFSIASDSDGVMNGLVEFTINYEVIADVLAGDFNADGVVNAADYTVLRDGLGDLYTEQDIATWRANYGAVSLAAAVSVPEPSGFAVLAAGLVATRWRSTRCA